MSRVRNNVAALLYVQLQPCVLYVSLGVNGNIRPLLMHYVFINNTIRREITMHNANVIRSTEIMQKNGYLSEKLSLLNIIVRSF